MSNQFDETLRMAVCNVVSLIETQRPEGRRLPPPEHPDWCQSLFDALCHTVWHAMAVTDYGPLVTNEEIRVAWQELF